jgi:CHRD domain
MKALLKYTLAFGLLTVPQIVCANPTLIGVATLTGAQEVSPEVTSATGSISVSLDGDNLDISLFFTGLIGGPATAANIHCCAPAGINTIVALLFPTFPIVTSGTYTNTFDLTSSSVYTSSFLTASGGSASGAEATLIAGIEGGQAYVNLSDTLFPGGEIRGDIAAPSVPEPSSLGITALLLTGLLFALVARRPLRS